MSSLDINRGFNKKEVPLKNKIIRVLLYIVVILV